ncbi:MAG: energy transducer TonB [Desulfobulbaceae bacterium]
MTVWEEYQGNEAVRMRWLPPLLLSLILHLCLLRMLVPAREIQPPRIPGSSPMAVILTAPVQSGPVPAAQLPRPQPQPASARPAVAEQPVGPVGKQEEAVPPTPRLVPVKIKKSLLPESSHAGRPPEAVATPVVATNPTGEEPPVNRSVNAHPTGAATAPSAPAAIRAAVPLATGNRPPEYPVLARKRGWQGRVLLAVAVGSDGSVQEVRVHSGSGHELLDEAALRAVRAWRFQPGNRGGKPVATEVQVPVHFQLEDNR